jgi:MoxR-like ATPase
MLASASRARAVLQGRDFVIPDDVKSLVLPTLRHRIMPTARADIEGLGTARILAGLLEGIPAPR